jgi:hypothetical protein
VIVVVVIACVPDRAAFCYQKKVEIALASDQRRRSLALSLTYP